MDYFNILNNADMCMVSNLYIAEDTTSWCKTESKMHVTRSVTPYFLMKHSCSLEFRKAVFLDNSSKKRCQWYSVLFLTVLLIHFHANQLRWWLSLRR